MNTEVLTKLETEKIKKATVEHEVHPLIQKRWSPRSFSDKDIPESELMRLFEAARWSASANNEQPWQYSYAFRGTEGFEKIWDGLLPGNQPWAKNASVLVVAKARGTFTKSGKANAWAVHDLGMANAQLLMQATQQEIYAHFMAGFDKEKIKASLSISENVEPICVIALGYLGEAEALEEPYRTRELTPRNRLNISAFTNQV